MSTVPILVPQLGEGLVEARILTLLKSAGDSILRDEPIVEIETDKATVVVESPISGTLEHWSAAEGDIVAIGAAIATVRAPEAADTFDATPTLDGTGPPIPPVRLDSSLVPEPPLTGESHDPQPAPFNTGSSENGADSAVHPAAGENHTASDDSLRNRRVSPRIRSYCRDRGIAAEDILSIPTTDPSHRLDTADVDRWLAQREWDDFQDQPLSARQRSLAQRLVQAHLQVVPASLEVECLWSVVQQAKASLVDSWTGRPPSSLELIAWSVVRAMAGHPKFRSAFVGENTIREYRRAHLGVAVSLPDDELAYAVLRSADTLSLPDFVEGLRRRIHDAREGEGQTAGAQLYLSYMAKFGIITARPAVVPPAVATLFVGAPYPVAQPGENGAVIWAENVRLVLGIDHRLINGVAAAAFLHDVQQRINNLPALASESISEPRASLMT